MNRWKVGVLAFVLLAGGVARYAYVDWHLARWKGPQIARDAAGTDECGDVAWVVPRQPIQVPLGGHDAPQRTPGRTIAGDDA